MNMSRPSLKPAGQLHPPLHLSKQLAQVHLREILYQPKFYPKLPGEGLKHEGFPAELEKELRSRHSRSTSSARSWSVQQRLVPTAFLVPRNSNMDPSPQYKELLKMPPAKQPKCLTFLRKLMRLNMLGTRNIVFKSANWLPEELNGDRSKTETCFFLFSCPSPLPQREEKISSLSPV